MRSARIGLQGRRGPGRHVGDGGLREEWGKIDAAPHGDQREHLLRQRSFLRHLLVAHVEHVVLFLECAINDLCGSVCLFEV